MEKFRGKYRIPSARLSTWNYASQAMYFVTVCTKNREHSFGEIVWPDSMPAQQVMRLSEIGSVVESEWLKTTDIRPDMNLTLDEFQVMPNHFHAIIIIGDNQYNSTAQMGLPIEIHVHNQAFDPMVGMDGTDCDCGMDGGCGMDGDCGMDGVDGMDGFRGRDAMHRVSTDPESESEPEPEPEPNTKPDPFLEWLPEWEPNMIRTNKFAPQSKNLGSIMRGFKSAVTTYARENHIVFNWQPRYYDHVIRNYEDYVRIKNYIRNNPANWKNDRLR